MAIYDGTGAHLVRDEGYLRAAIKYEEPDLVVLDSLRRLTPGSDENDSGDMAEVVGLIKDDDAIRTGCGVTRIRSIYGIRANREVAQETAS